MYKPPKLKTQKTLHEIAPLYILKASNCNYKLVQSILRCKFPFK